MRDILFLLHRIPFPPDRGDKIRSHHLLLALAARAPVHVGTFAENAQDLAQEPALASIAASHLVARRGASLIVPGIAAFASGKPVSLTAFNHSAMRAWVCETLAQQDIGTIFVFSGQMGQYVPEGFGGRVVIDLCDVDSAKFEDYSRQAAWPRSSLLAREARLLAFEEERLAHLADTALLISDAEAALFAGRLRDPAGTQIRVLGNGIDAEFYDPAKIGLHPDLLNGGPHLVFTGQMDYPPNVAAALRMACAILPRIREHHPVACFHIVGRAPAAELKALDGQGGVRVWGEVADVRPFLAAADLVCAPLTIARGVQNKVLEAMAMARPVLLSREAATGIEARDGEEFRIGQGDDALVAAALDLLAAPERARAMGKAARAYVVADKSWSAQLAQLDDLVEGGTGMAARDAA